ncbi:MULTISPECIES: hypothetical protein [unclassified Kitasatospora]|uniref:hypothetical protein n=1 Tax=unclassified Kitasatospora TaxID=2633591 RepID=UPI0012F891AB|nr:MULTISPECIES: hypothetical protein [unclassified Kitasatospora]
MSTEASPSDPGPPGVMPVDNLEEHVVADTVRTADLAAGRWLAAELDRLEPSGDGLFSVAGAVACRQSVRRGAWSTARSTGRDTRPATRREDDRAARSVGRLA